MRYTDHVSTKRVTSKRTPQSKKAAKGQVKNSAGGFSFKLDDWGRLERFLILGSEGGTYYIGEKKLTKDNAKVLMKCLKSDPKRAIETIVNISDKGRAPKNDPAIFALALASKAVDDPETRSMAYQALPSVCRTGTHLLQYLGMVRDLGGFGSGFMRAVTRWYMDRPASNFALQVAKYQSRAGETHSNALRLVHPGMHKELTESQKAIMHWVLHGWESVGTKPHPDKDLQLIWAFEHAKKLRDKKDVKKLVKLITDYRLPHECIPSEMRNYPEVWDAMLPSMGITALVRNLGKLSQIGLLKPLSAAHKLVVSRLTNVEDLKRGRVHPVSLLVALKTYARGHGVKGNLTWKPDQRVADALNDGFYLSFDTIDPVGNNHLLALDISGSMDSEIAGLPLSCMEGALAMSLVTARAEPAYHILGFDQGLIDLRVSPTTRLDEALNRIRRNYGGTDCALPMLWATQNKIEVDTFAVYTDNETWAGRVHPHQALEEYRQRMGRPAKMVVVGMAATPFTIANPDDAGMMDVVGFDTTAPAVIADFARE